MAVTSSRGAGSALSLLSESEESLEPEREEDDAPPLTDSPEDAKTIHARLLDWIEDKNLARDILPDELDRLGELVVREYEIDEESRAEWKAEAEKALKFAVQKAAPKQYPWPDSSNIIFPLITSAAMRFGAMAYPAIVPSRSVVKGVVWGDDKGSPATQDGKPTGAPKLTPDGQPIWLVPPGDKAKRAERVGEHMSWQLLEEMGYWEEQTDTMLHQLPITGGAVRKTYRDARDDSNASELVDLMKLVWNMHAPSFEKAPRHTEIMELYPHEIEELERDDETFLPLIYGAGDQAPQGSDDDAAIPDPSDSAAPHTYLEQHRRYDLDGDGYEEPLIITVHKRSAKVVRITARYDEKGIETDPKTRKLKKIEPIQAYTLYRFLPNPKGGSYPCGFGHFLKPLNEAVNTTINQMFDAGHLQIAGGGFIGSGLSLPAGNVSFRLGQFIPVNNRGASIRDSIYQIPFPGPSEVLFQLLGFLVSAAKEVASIQDILTGDAALANTPPTTMVALVEQGMKVYTAIYKRIYRALKSELKKLYRLNRIYLGEDERYRIGDTWRVVTAEDYRLGGGVEPVADPTMVTDMQRITRAAMLVDRAKNNPLINPLAAERYLFEAAQIPRIDDFLPEKLPQPPPSPEQLEVQLKTQLAQSKIGQERALELMQYTQAMLNLQKAKSEASGPQLQWMESQLDMMRLHIEALNTTVKAAAIDAQIHGNRLSHHAAMTGHAVAHDNNLSQTAQRAREVANERPDAGSPDLGGGSPASAPLSQPGDGSDGGNGIPAMAPSPGNAQLPTLPGTAGPGAQ